LVTSRKYGAARCQYAAAIDLIRVAGEFPALPVRKTADAFYFEGKYQRAIQTLDDLAAKAAQVGDLVTQAWAQADAAWLLDVDCRSHAKSERPGRNLEMDQRATSLRSCSAHRICRRRRGPRSSRSAAAAATTTEPVDAGGGLRG
jgi:hypothetical protein